MFLVHLRAKDCCWCIMGRAVTLGKCFALHGISFERLCIHMYTHEKVHRGSLRLIMSKWQRCHCLALLHGPESWGSLHSSLLVVTSLCPYISYSHSKCSIPPSFPPPSHPSIHPSINTYIHPFTSLHNPFFSSSLCLTFSPSCYPLLPLSTSFIPPCFYLSLSLTIHSSLHQSLPPIISFSPTPLVCSSLLLSMHPCSSVPVLISPSIPHPSLYLPIILHIHIPSPTYPSSLYIIE